MENETTKSVKVWQSNKSRFIRKSKDLRRIATNSTFSKRRSTRLLGEILGKERNKLECQICY